MGYLQHLSLKNACCRLCIGWFKSFASAFRFFSLFEFVLHKIRAYLVTLNPNVWRANSCYEQKWQKTKQITNQPKFAERNELKQQYFNKFNVCVRRRETMTFLVFRRPNKRRSVPFNFRNNVKTTVSASNDCIENANMFAFHLTFTRNSYDKNK